MIFHEIFHRIKAKLHNRMDLDNCILYIRSRNEKLFLASNNVTDLKKHIDSIS